MDVPTLQAARASALSVGQTSVDVATFGGDLSAAIAARGPGKRYWLNSAAYAEAATDVVIGAGTILEGVGSGDTTLTLSSGARVVTDGFDGLTGTNPADSPGVGQFALRHFAVEGGGGVRIYGYAYEVEDVTVRGTAGVGFYSEWTNADNPIPPDASMEARIRGLKTHHCGSTGFHFNGPHDSALSEVVSYFNTSGTGILLDEKANGVHLVNGHAYGVDHSYALQMLGTGQQVVACQAEGANGPQVLITKAGSSFHGRVYSAGANPNVKGIVLGTPTDGAAGVSIDAIIEQCLAGAIDWTNDLGGSSIRAVINAASGAVPTVGTLNPGSQAYLVPLGGVQIFGWAEPWEMGRTHFAGALNAKASLTVVDGQAVVQAVGTAGAVLDLASIGTASPNVNPAAGVGRLFFRTGTTGGGTLRLVVQSASGTLTTILDNIPA